MASETDKTRSVMVIENETYSVIQISNHGRSKNLSSRYPLQRGGRVITCSHGTHILQAKKKKKKLVQSGTKESWASLSFPFLIFHIILQSKQKISGSLRGENIYLILGKHHEKSQLPNLTRCHYFLWRQNHASLSVEQTSLW